MIKNANLLTLIKKTTDNNKNYTTKLVTENFNKDDLSPQELSGERVWKQAGFFGEIRTDYNMEKVNFPENALIYINQAYLTIYKNKKIFYANYFILGQIIEASNPPKDIKNYELQDREVKYLSPKYSPETGDFQGLYETIGFIVVRGDDDEITTVSTKKGRRSCILRTEEKSRIVFVVQCSIDIKCLLNVVKLSKILYICIFFYHP